MKSAFLIAPALIFSAVHTTDATASTYASTISSHNIMQIQHSALSNAFNAFESNRITPAPAKKQAKPSPDRYGTMSMYGEYGDDGSVFQGRNGGETPALRGTWANWQHISDDVHFNDYAVVDTDTDIITLGLAGGQKRTSHGTTEWGLFGGYFNGDQTTTDTTIDQQGGFAGVYSGYAQNNFRVVAGISGGVMDNGVEFASGEDSFVNMWVGAGVRSTYDIPLDSTFTLRPGLQIEYTWINSPSYTSESGMDIKPDNFSAFNIVPSFRAIKHIANGWYGSANVKYVATITQEDALFVDSVALPALEIDNYTEYGITLEKSIAGFDFAATLAHRDGGRSGWLGQFNIKYTF